MTVNLNHSTLVRTHLGDDDEDLSLFSPGRIKKGACCGARNLALSRKQPSPNPKVTFTAHQTSMRLKSSLLAGLLLALAYCTLASTKDAASTMALTGAPSMATTAYDESIKWSFGGWAPLNGAKPKRGSHNGTSAPAVSTTATNSGQSSSSTTPLPSQHKKQPQSQIAQQPLQIKQAAKLNDSIPNRQQQQLAESLSESASSQTHEKVQFAAPQHQAGPAYAMAHQQQVPFAQHSQQRPMQFSPPAPTPIVRDHLLPMAAHHQQYPPRPGQDMAPKQQYPAQMPERMQAHFRQMEQHHRAQHQQMMQRQHEHRQRLQHMHMMQQQHQQGRYLMGAHNSRPPMMHPHMQQQQHMQQPSLLEQARAMPRYPGQPIAHHQHQQHQQPPPVGAFKLIEGEQPIMFTSNSLPNERIPMIEVSGRTNYTGGPQYSQPQPVQDHSATFASAMAAVDGPQQQQQQQAGYKQEQMKAAQPSNNIQEIKQQVKGGHPDQQPAANSDKLAKSYLTIPVAVETEGDKVLTADDINEIEKHVINVLPNLKTADKVVKLADAHLTLASLKGTIEEHNKQQEQQHQQQQQQQLAGPPVEGPNLHQSHYEEHRSTMKQLEADLKDAPKQQYSQQQPGSAAVASLNQATTAHAQHLSSEAPSSGNSAAHQGDSGDSHQYFVQAGPVQELPQVDDIEQVNEYNLLKNDLMQNFRYEPTRASAVHQQQQLTGSTPAMPYRASSEPNKQPEQQMRHQQPTVSRYFQQGAHHHHQGSHGSASRHHNRPHQNGGGLFARLNGQQNRAPYTQQPATATTKTIMGGRKVSEVMRPLIHTTPVPMTSPLHVPSVEPEKVDAIQLIAGHQANDKQPMVVEAHQLVNHTPDGGIDYNSGANFNMLKQQQNYSTATTPMAAGYEQQQQQYEPQDQNNEGQGAIIEYVALTDQQLNNAVNQHNQQQRQQQGYELAGQPEAYQQQQPHSTSKSPFMYDYSMLTTQQQQQQPSSQQHQEEPGNQATPPSYVVGEQPAQPQLVVWSPSVASEHQQQQMELAEHAGPMQQIDMPATAGYNFFNPNQPQQQQTSSPDQAEYEQQQQQQGQRWRTKAGGSQPNPDAQYDGQIVKDDQKEPGQEQAEQQAGASPEEEQQQQQAHPQPQQQQYAIYGSPDKQSDLARLAAATNSRPDTRDASHEQQQQQEERQAGQHGNQESYEQQQVTTQAALAASSYEPSNYQQITNSYVGGAQINHPHQPESPPGQSQHNSDPALGQYSYMKLDRDRQQSHLAQHQAQHQAQLAELMNNQQQREQQGYQTTTPMSITTMAAIEQQQQEQASADNGGYMTAEQQQQSVAGDSQESVQQPEQQHQVVLDQQSLIADPNHSEAEFSDDDGAKQKGQQPAGIYQVYQAYYAPKDHKPLPGYVRLSLDEFNELFRDAEIQYVDKNLNGLANAVANHHQQQQPAHQPEATLHEYEQANGNAESMKASASESQSILVDRRSISSPGGDKKSSLSSAESSLFHAQEPKGKFGHASVKKIISIRNSRHLARQSKIGRSSLKKVSETTTSTTTASTTTSTIGTAEASRPTTTVKPPNNAQAPLKSQKQTIASSKKSKMETPKKTPSQAEKVTKHEPKQKV